LKKTGQILLLLLVVGSLGYWGWGRFITQERKPDPIVESDPVREIEKPAEQHSVVVTYFTTDVRCDSCRRIEDLTRNAVEIGFPEQLQDGGVSFRIRNLDDAENAHFTKEYELSFKTVVISKTFGDEECSWKKMDDVWNLLGDPDGFDSYISTAVVELMAPDACPAH
jgi:hypothetical protein